jgi:TetR/AcrR family transcriptional regulator, regulator of cefoperazone and chloramphenicol sensitivity
MVRCSPDQNLIPRTQEPMELGLDPRATDADLTLKARIRNTALDLYARDGADRVSMRAIAAAVGVTIGSVQHHFINKEGVGDAVEQLVVDYYAMALAQAPNEGTPAQIAATRDEAVRQMLGQHPEVRNYVRRALLDPAGPRGKLLERLTDLVHDEIVKLRNAGQASTKRSESIQTIEVLMRQMGRDFLQPVVDIIWNRLEGNGITAKNGPVVDVTVETPNPHARTTRQHSTRYQ